MAINKRTTVKSNLISAHLDGAPSATCLGSHCVDTEIRATPPQIASDYNLAPLKTSMFSFPCAFIQTFTFFSKWDFFICHSCIKQQQFPLQLIIAFANMKQHLVVLSLSVFFCLSPPFLQRSCHCGINYQRRPFLSLGGLLNQAHQLRLH